MNVKDKNLVNNIPIDLLAATRMTLINIIKTGDLPSMVIDELKEIISYIEQKMNENNIDLNTYVSNSDMQKAQKYMGGYSGIKFDNNFEKEYDEGDIWVKLCGIAIGLYLLYCLIVWIGSVLTNLWNQGIIQIILAIIGVGGAGVGIYRLWEFGFFDKIKSFFENQKNTDITKRNNKIDTYSKKNLKTIKNNSSKSDNKTPVVKFLATATVIALLGAGYNVIDKNAFNGKKISLFKFGRYDETQIQPSYEFNDLLIVGKSSSSDAIIDEIDISFENDSKYLIKPKYCCIDYDELRNLYNDELSSLNEYNDSKIYEGEQKYYHFDRTLSFWENGFVEQVINLFTDYRNALIYYASKGDYDKFSEIYSNFVCDCYFFIKKDNVLQLGNPFIQGSWKFSDLHVTDQKIILIMCDELLNINLDYGCIYVRDNSYDSVKVRELKDFIHNKINNCNEAENYVLRKHGHLYE